MSEFILHPIQLAIAALLCLGSMAVYSADFWSHPTPLPPESVRMADTWAVPGR